MIREPLRRTMLAVVSAVLAVTVTVAVAAADFVVEDWSKYPAGTRGIPPGWEGQKWGSPAYDFAIVQDGGRKVLHLKSKDEGSTISKDIKGKINLKETPFLEWTWKAVVLPVGGDSRKKELDDQAIQVFVAWPRFPEMVRSRIIGYVWDTTVPVGTIAKSEKTGTVTYIVVRSGPGELGKWITERRNVREDFKKVYGEEPDNPAALSISIDSNDTKSVSESFVGPVAFKVR
ncbi:MAG: DUF3047 domain-containing protein [Candidatus Rokubacteria bacterium]|nr:DUF3047 domain-containing protein [Candidatus Rokubacteria bacterium]